MVGGGARLTYLHPLLVLCLAIAAWGAIRRRSGLVTAAVAAIFVISWPPLSWLVVQPLEGWYPRTVPATSDADAIVVLSAGILPPGGGRPAAVADDSTYERCSYAAWLYGHVKAVPVLATGGSMPSVDEPVAEVMRRILIAKGVPESQAWTEDQAKSTYENARYSAEILRRRGIRRILLVTEAYHMPRSERCFRKQGLTVEPAPCGFHTLRATVSDFIPDGGAILDDERDLHEYIGLLWYKIAGRI